MEIKSNTIGKLLKIKEKKVFSDEFTFVSELLQNAQRSKAKVVCFKIDNGMLYVRDDGVGCSNPDDLLTLDHSSWESTKEGFGIGFWSVLSVPDMAAIRVSSFKWTAFIDTNKLFNEKDLTVKVTERETALKGFVVGLYAPNYFGDPEIKSRLRDYLVKAARYMPFVTYFGDERLERADILTDYTSTNFNKIFSHRQYSSNLEVSSSWATPTVYYDNRKVAPVWQLGGKVDGVITVSAGKLNLKEPDRTEIINDDLFRQFLDGYRRDCRLLYLQYVAENGVDDSGMAEAIDEFLTPSDYMKYLNIDGIRLTDEVGNNKPNRAAASLNSASSANLQSVESVEANDNFCPNADNVIVGDFAEENYKASCPVRRIKRPETSTGNFSEYVKTIKRRAFWVKAQEVESYNDFIAEAEYAGLKVIIAKNVLYEKALAEKGIPHISMIESSLVKQIERKDVGLRNGKEVAFIKALAPICTEFNLPLNCFKIANLSETTELWLENKRVFHKVFRNKPWDVKIFGETDGNSIYLDRTALSLKNYDIRSNGVGIGLNEVKAVLAALPTIAHEMAHFLYHTTDNTVEHYKKIEEISHRIGKCYGNQRGNQKRR